MTTSISQAEHTIDETIKTAVIYSISDLGDYLVEIRYQNEHYFIGSEGQSEQFGNMASAKNAAVAHGAIKGFQALSTTYEEVEATTLHLNVAGDGGHFDYIPIDLG